MNTDTMKHYIDFSAKTGLEYMLIDDGWAEKRENGPNDSGSDLTRTSPNIDMPALLSYAKSKNVRLWLWAHWTDIDRQVDEAFPLFEKWGIARSEDLFHESRRSVDGQLVPPHRAEGLPRTSPRSTITAPSNRMAWSAPGPT